ncbi:hypothetical protein CLOM_g14737 [Closterium sp. NIES-68]|nr:hypothetical protein CLOM_g14737 [Closterium sp. NIES-68]GJP57416.1 hypothetical protein CLOP_g18 [Closterium sp. NIES-67]
MRSLVATLLIVSALCAVASAYDCITPCQQPANTSYVVPTCTQACTNCVALTYSGCSTYFQPIWAALTNTATSQVYQGATCGQSCSGSLEWWAWLLISFAILFVCIGIGLCLYSCLDKRG